ncbi:MBL fold metallo-hydrolase [[Mycoplasma] testudinis]|uniref:MBL fold metallo-hydrolase n=1 Tax=[Mycoplasma] testudinis TaxID=33924 RepID=UPI000489A6F5|nr:MBL fold metallo-hydrolase [[Mycoplasma] testudinis]
MSDDCKVLNESISLIINQRMSNNSFILHQNNQAVVIDPSWNAIAIKKWLIQNNYVLKGIIFTHSHFDHIGDSQILQKFYMCPFYIHKKGKSILLNGYNSPAFAYDFVFQSKDIKTFDTNQDLMIDSMKIETLYVPGHTPDSCLFRFGNYVFSGDHLFIDSIGRTDFQYSNINDMNQSLKIAKHWIQLDNILCPGHQFSFKKFSLVLKENNFLNGTFNLL